MTASQTKHLQGEVVAAGRIEVQGPMQAPSAKGAEGSKIPVPQPVTTAKRPERTRSRIPRRVITATEVEADQLAEANKKSSCLPKLFMLLMPFAAIGAYLFLRS